jgi:hypothetical protein
VLVLLRVRVLGCEVVQEVGGQLAASVVVVGLGQAVQAAEKDGGRTDWASRVSLAPVLGPSLLGAEQKQPGLEVEEVVKGGGEAGVAVGQLGQGEGGLLGLVVGGWRVGWLVGRRPGDEARRREEGGGGGALAEAAAEGGRDSLQGWAQVRLQLLLVGQLLLEALVAGGAGLRPRRLADQLGQGQGELQQAGVVDAAEESLTLRSPVREVLVGGVQFAVSMEETLRLPLLGRLASGEEGLLGQWRL